MRRRQIYALRNSEIAPVVLPDAGADAGSAAALSDRAQQPAPQGITYQHNERTRVTLPITEFNPQDVRLADQVARMNGLDRAIEMIEANSPPWPVHVDFTPQPVSFAGEVQQLTMHPEKRKRGRPRKAR